jgi:PAS domain S-box-containing protein
LKEIAQLPRLPLLHQSGVMRAAPGRRLNVSAHVEQVRVQRLEAQLREHAQRLAEAERVAGFGVWRWDIAAGVVTWSEQLHAIYGLAPGEFEGTVEGFVGRLHPDDRERIGKHIAHALETLEPFAFEERIVQPNGNVRLLLSQGRAIAGEDGRAAALVGVCHDVTDRAAAERALGASERRMRAIMDNSPSAVAVKDLEGRYRMANAECGRVVGVPAQELIGHYCHEHLEREVADRIRANEQLAAATGEPIYEEIVLVRDGEPRTFVLSTFALPDAAGHPVETCTIGTDVTERKELEDVRLQRRAWQHRIESAIAEDRLLACAQPIVDLATGDDRKCELLVRMRENGDVLQPPAFLPAAERFGLIRAIDVWMVRRAIELAPDRAPNVNLSAISLCDTSVCSEILELLAAAPEAARQIVFEITETAAAEHLDSARAFAEAVTALGGGMALDDFGTGFTSFTYLRDLPLRFLKIDTTFVRNAVRSNGDRRIVQSIIGVAQQFGLQTIAEGVEDEQTLIFLRGAGADHAQGFLLGRPKPTERRFARTGGGR